MGKNWVTQETLIRFQKTFLNRRVQRGCNLNHVMNLGMGNTLLVDSPSRLQNRSVETLL